MKPSRLDCVWSKIGCFGARNELGGENNDQKIVNKRINKRIQNDKQEYRSTHRLILLGTPDSGKTTILKQIHVLHIRGLSEWEKRQKLLDIKKNLRDTTVYVARAMKHLKPPINLQFIENEPHVHYMLNEAVIFEEEDEFTDIFFDKLQALWNDKGVRECYDLLNESEANGSIKYFLEKVKSIRDKTYRPTDQDLATCFLDLKTGISEVKISFGHIKFHISDVGSQKGERMKWIQCFHEITAILFVVDSSGYDVVSGNVASPNRLQEATDLFKKIWNNRWLRTVSVILFLNKQDLLEEKITAGKSRLQDHFPEFNEYTLVEENVPGFAKIPVEDPEVTRAKYFIKDEFLRLCQSGESRHYCYPHFTCGTDSEYIQRLCSDCRDIIQRMCLRQYELL